MNPLSVLVRKSFAVVCLAVMLWVFPRLESQAQSIAQQQLAEGVTFEVQSLRRINGKILQMDFALINDTGDDLDPKTLGLTYTGWMTGIQLLDMQNLKLYLVGRYTGGYTCSQSALVPADGRQDYYAQYAAPPSKVDKMAIKFPVAPPLFDIPITE